MDTSLQGVSVQYLMDDDLGNVHHDCGPVVSQDLASRDEKSPLGDDAGAEASEVSAKG